MAFLDNASTPQDVGRAKTVRDAVVMALRAKDQGDETDLVEVLVRYARGDHARYQEAAIVIPRDVLPSVFALADSYLGYGRLHIDATTANDLYSKRVVLTPDRKTLVIEILYKDHQPEQNQDEKRRQSLRGRRTQIDTSAINL